MKDTGFKPDVTQRFRIAPTTYLNGKLLQEEVHYPTAYRMGGVSGHAGLFSTAGDLAGFVQMLLNGGSVNGAEILKPTSIEEMTARQQTVNGAGWWGLGWKSRLLFNSNRDELVPARSFGHSGFTGTSIWIDPDSKSYVIILTSRVHPRGAGDVKPLRTEVLRFVTAALGRLSTSQSMRRPSQSAKATEQAVNEKLAPQAGGVRSGVDELRDQDFAPLTGLRVGLITNHTGIDSKSVAHSISFSTRPG